jgi:hypothetical protein
MLASSGISGISTFGTVNETKKESLETAIEDLK